MYYRAALLPSRCSWANLLQNRQGRGRRSETSGHRPASGTKASISIHRDSAISLGVGSNINAHALLTHKFCGINLAQHMMVIGPCAGHCGFILLLESCRFRLLRRRFLPGDRRTKQNSSQRQRQPCPWLNLIFHFYLDLCPANILSNFPCCLLHLYMDITARVI